MKDQPQCFISIQNLFKQYPDFFNTSRNILEDINLNISQGEFTSLVGEPGCGKSTLLRLISGLEQQQDGKILINGASPLEQKQLISSIHQEYRLFSWLNVVENLRIALHEQQLTREQENQRIDEQLEIFKLQEFRNAYPHQLSESMNLKIVLAKSLMNDPQILLLDNPFKNIDSLIRHQLQDELKKMCYEKNVTVILATGDINDAIYLSDQVIFMQANPGRIKNVQKIHLPYPRKRDDARLINIKKQVVQYLEKKISLIPSVGKSEIDFSTCQFSH